MTILTGKIAVVTGASRNAGRGIAVELGLAGATVYVTGRSRRGGQPTTASATGTVEETAELVTTVGGLGIPVVCDHTDDGQVEALFARVRREHDRLDILVNNVWGGYEDMQGFEGCFWEQPTWRWEQMFGAGARAHFTASRLAVPLMLPQRAGLIVNTTFYDRGKYFKPLLYDLAKATINRMAYSMALELREYNIAAVALSPGWLRTEYLLREFHTDDLNAHKIPDLVLTESTHYIGRAVAALAGDPDVLKKSGQVLTVGDLAQAYGFTDVDGRWVPPFQIPPERLMD